MGKSFFKTINIKIHNNDLLIFSIKTVTYSFFVHRNNLPVTYLYSKQEDTTAYCIFYNTIKTRVGPIAAKTFLSDIAPSMSNAQKSTMQEVPNHLLCSWHVNRAVRLKIGSILTKNSKEYDHIKSLFYQLKSSINQESFNHNLILFRNAIKTLNISIDIYNLLNYFDKIWLKEDKISSWAYYARINSGINTNMALERLHK